MVFLRAPPLLPQSHCAQNQGIVAKVLSAIACPADWRVRNFAATMDTVGEIINNANLAFSLFLTSGASHFESQIPASMATRESRKTLGTRGAEAVLHVLLQHRDPARGGETCIPLQDSQLCLLLLEICPEQLTWVHSNLSPAPHCPLLHSGLS